MRLLVARVQAKERAIDPATIEWTPPAWPFFGKALVWRPRTVPTTLRQPIIIEGVAPLVMKLLAA